MAAITASTTAPGGQQVGAPTTLAQVASDQAFSLPRLAAQQLANQRPPTVGRDPTQLTGKHTQSISGLNTSPALGATITGTQLVAAHYGDTAVPTELTAIAGATGQDFAALISNNQKAGVVAEATVRAQTFVPGTGNQQQLGNSYTVLTNQALNLGTSGLLTINSPTVTENCQLRISQAHYLKEQVDAYIGHLQQSFTTVEGQAVINAGGYTGHVVADSIEVVGNHKQLNAETTLLQGNTCWLIGGGSYKPIKLAPGQSDPATFTPVLPTDPLTTPVSSRQSGLSFLAALSAAKDDLIEAAVAAGVDYLESKVNDLIDDNLPASLGGVINQVVSQAVSALGDDLVNGVISGNLSGAITEALSGIQGSVTDIAQGAIQEILGDKLGPLAGVVELGMDYALGKLQGNLTSQVTSGLITDGTAVGGWGNYATTNVLGQHGANITSTLGGVIIQAMQDIKAETRSGNVRTATNTGNVAVESVTGEVEVYGGQRVSIESLFRVEQTAPAIILVGQVVMINSVKLRPKPRKPVTPALQQPPEPLGVRPQDSQAVLNKLPPSTGIAVQGTELPVPCTAAAGSLTSTMTPPTASS